MFNVTISLHHCAGNDPLPSAAASSSSSDEAYAVPAAGGFRRRERMALDTAGHFWYGCGTNALDKALLSSHGLAVRKLQQPHEFSACSTQLVKLL